MGNARNEPLGGTPCAHGEPFNGYNCHHCRSAPTEDTLAEMRRLWESLWQPMETAPKDGTHILVRSPKVIPTTVHWFDGAWQLSVNQMAEFSEYVWDAPTHWMPLSDNGTQTAGRRSSPCGHGAGATCADCDPDGTAFPPTTEKGDWLK